MAKVLGLREQRVQFFYDTDFRTVGASAGADITAAEKVLFASASPGNLARTNMPSAGQLTSDQTFLTFAVRHEINFYNVGGLAAGVTLMGATSNFATTEELSIWTMNSSTFQFQVSAKVEFEGPVCMTPAGAGPNGLISGAAGVSGTAQDKDSLLTNGVPQAPSIYTLPLPVAITKRQGIAMIEKKFVLGSAAAGDVVGAINQYEGGKLFRAYIDGYNTRDVL